MRKTINLILYSGLNKRKNHYVFQHSGEKEYICVNGNTILFSQDIKSVSIPLIKRNTTYTCEVLVPDMVSVVGDFGSIVFCVV